MQRRMWIIGKLKLKASLHAILIKKSINAFLGLSTMTLNFWEKITCRENKLIYILLYLLHIQIIIFTTEILVNLDALML